MLVRVVVGNPVELSYSAEPGAGQANAETVKQETPIATFEVPIKKELTERIVVYAKDRPETLAYKLAVQYRKS